MSFDIRYFGSELKPSSKQSQKKKSPSSQDDEEEDLSSPLGRRLACAKEIVKYLRELTSKSYMNEPVARQIFFLLGTYLAFALVP